MKIFGKGEVEKNGVGTKWNKEGKTISARRTLKNKRKGHLDRSSIISFFKRDNWNLKILSFNQSHKN